VDSPRFTFAIIEIKDVPAPPGTFVLGTAPEGGMGDRPPAHPG
jgi:hypothetical protein